MVVIVANPGDPTAGSDQGLAGKTVALRRRCGTLVVQQIERPERDGLLAGTINFDPTILPSGDPHVGRPVPGCAVGRLREAFIGDRRTAEAKDYPRIAPEAKP